MAAPSTPQPEAASQQGPSHIVTAMQTGLSYDVEALSPASQRNAQDGLCNNKLFMLRCYSRDNDFHFELQERIRVTVPNNGAPTCSTCPNRDGRACRHIWWVDDQILSTVVSEEARAQFKYQVSKDGQAVRHDSGEEVFMFRGWLEEKGLEEVARLGGWWRQDPMDQRDVRFVEQTAAHILSVFEPCGILSKQHGQDSFEMLQRDSQALFARYKNEMIRQVKSQPFLLIALGAAVPSAERDLLHLTKIHSRIECIFFDFGYWVAMRTPNDSNLDATAEALRHETGCLHSFVLDPNHSNMAGSLQVRIAGILLYTLEQLVKHAGDVLANAVVTTPQYSGLSLQDRNLLHKLIDPKAQGVFVLDVLKDLSPEVRQDEMVQDRVQILAEALRKESAAEKYVEWLEEVVGLDE